MATWYQQGYFTENLLVRKEGEEKWSTLSDLIRVLQRVPFVSPENNVPLSKPLLPESNPGISEKERLERELKIYQVLYQKYVVDKQEYDRKLLER